MNFSFNHVLFFIAILGFLSCASTGNPSGGPQDETPPRVLIEKSEDNFQTNYIPEKVDLYFDEWIELKNPFKEIMVSPPMINNPRVTSRGKKITIDFSEADTLRENATYTVNFGEAIVDFREANVLKNYSYVFSTGEFIDSLSVSGKIKNAYTKEPSEGILVMLYDDLTDSAFYKERPFYFSRTDEDGNFKIEYLKSDTFQLVALQDGNLNYRYDGTIETIAFLDSLVFLTDSLNQNFELYTFELPAKPLIIYKDSDVQGLITMVFNRKPDSLEFNLLNDINYTHLWSGDSLKLWYEPTQDSFVRVDILGDTLSFDNYDFNKKDKNPLRLISRDASQIFRIHPTDSIVIRFNTPIKEFLQDSIFLIDTSKQKIDFELEIDSSDSRNVIIRNKWLEAVSYEFEMQPMAVIDTYNQTNDSIALRFFISDREKYGNINLNLSNLSDSLNYLLLLKEGDKTIRQQKICDTSNFEMVFKNLKPANYRVTLIKDDNANKEWDTGDYLKRIQPEKVQHFDLEELRANWDLDVEITANFN